MKKLYTFIVVLFLTATTFAQTQDKMNYQAAVRDGSGNLISNQPVGMQISILQGSASGGAVYVETQIPNTNANGLVSLIIGDGNVISGDLSTIDWASDIYFIKTEVDPAGGTNYTATGTSQLLSVPYALNAKTAESVKSTCGLSIGDTHEGGIIFYLDPSGCHGLVATEFDLGQYLWMPEDIVIDCYAYGNGIGNGEGNSWAILKWTEQECNNSGCNHYSSAAWACLNLTIGLYRDWYLPSKYELNLMYWNIGQGNALGLGNIGNFGNWGYWSSTEIDTTSAWFQDFGSNGSQGVCGKNYCPYFVRAVRSF